MKRVIIITITIFSLISCQRNDLIKEFDCTSSVNMGESKEMRDILKKFKIIVPKSWKTQLYYDEFKSQIYSADTTKNLTETYVLDIAWHQGELKLNEFFEQKVIDTLAINEQLTTYKSKFGKFHGKDAYWNLSEGIDSGFPYNHLELYIKTDFDEYFTITTKIYGQDNINTRLCESILIVDKIKFNE